MAVVHSLYREAGTVRIDEDACSECGQCAEICPSEVLSLEGGRSRIRDDSPLGCIACGHCMMVCPEGSITVTGRGISPEDLRPLPPEGQRANADGLAALLLARRSVRRFKRREVEPQILDRVVEMAASGPMGIPPWDVGCVIVSGRERVRELAGHIVRGYEGLLRIFRPWVLAVMRPLMGRARNEQYRHLIRPLAESYVRAHRLGKDHLFWDAPAVMVFHRSPYADEADATIACTYAMLAAESLGLGSTIIGGAAPVLRRNVELCRKLGVPAGNEPILTLILGYPAAGFKRTVRRRFTSVSTAS
jgi:ferredoxin